MLLLSFEEVKAPPRRMASDAVNVHTTQTLKMLRGKAVRVRRCPESTRAESGAWDADPSRLHSRKVHSKGRRVAIQEVSTLRYALCCGGVLCFVCVSDTWVSIVLRRHSGDETRKHDSAREADIPRQEAQSRAV